MLCHHEMKAGSSDHYKILLSNQDEEKRRTESQPSSYIYVIIHIIKKNNHMSIIYKYDDQNQTPIQPTIRKKIFLKIFHERCRASEKHVEVLLLAPK